MPIGIDRYDFRYQRLYRLPAAPVIAVPSPARPYPNCTSNPKTSATPRPLTRGRLPAPPARLAVPDRRRVRNGEQITRRDTLPRPRPVPQRTGRNGPKSAALIH